MDRSARSTSVYDSTLYGPIFSNPAMAALWSDDEMVKSWLSVETALAQVQAELGVIPTEAAQAIAKAALVDNLDWSRLALDTAEVGMAIKPVIDQIAAAGGPLVQQYLHWGATTQDVLDSGQALRLQRALALIKTQLCELIAVLSAMVEAHRHTLMVARTNAQDAAPSTWGFHASSYLTELCRHWQRLGELTPRATMGMYGGAIGNLASVGSQGIAIRNRLLAKLGLPCPQGQWNASHDGLVEVVQFFALVHGTLLRIANDVELMSRAPIAEVQEGESGGGSSTMPHKANPRAANMIQALARLGWMYASSAPAMLDQQDVRSSSARMLDWSLLPEACLAVSGGLLRANKLLAKLHINSQRMRDNFQASRHLILSEAVMMKLAEKVGREQAYGLVKDAIARHPEPHWQLPALLRDTPAVMAHFSDDELARACDPAGHLGASNALIDEALALAASIK
ncbi:class-II fumarase/aspartase family protein [Gallaecimonas pentaromativorans]|uniref:3-carboxy-cis,cis-muconate cycloisomerase n=1 Tax=Gallaecimonas pentaromativorans TaxID=584787 RepID=A0A3N1P469_9GAMM|nr:adenylosuccinate lyase family protein [Gallaecimonas pentaromativorans]ROQ21957.1 3-carboxy-cis,cis-muconate cycloisomerase [Gallaecimonas pentaromativorans]